MGQMKEKNRAYEEAFLQLFNFATVPFYWDDLEPEPGQVIAFTTPGGDDMAGIVIALDGRQVQVDFNHPLAGRSLTVRAQVLAVRAATDSSA